MADKGKWITVNGRHIFIKDGETDEQAFQRTFGVSSSAEPDRKNANVISNAFSMFDASSDEMRYDEKSVRAFVKGIASKMSTGDVLAVKDDNEVEESGSTRIRTYTKRDDGSFDVVTKSQSSAERGRKISIVGKEIVSSDSVSTHIASNPYHISYTKAGSSVADEEVGLKKNKRYR